MKKICFLMALVVLLSRCKEDEQVEPKNIEFNALQTSTRSAANTFFVNSNGNDAGDGSANSPWKTLRFAVTKVPANQGYTIELSAGIFVEDGLIEIPPGVGLAGAGIDKTIIKAAGSLNYNPANPDYAADKFLIRLNSSEQTNGNQTLEDFTIDGDSKKLHGGIYVRSRNNVLIDQVKVVNTNFTGMWLWDVKDSKLSNSQIINSSWGSSAYCSGALNVGNLENIEIDHLTIDESTGYGIKAIGPSGNNNIINLKLHDSRISVKPAGLWNNGSAPNIAIELWQVNLVKSEIYNTYVDNTISLVNSNNIPSTGIQTIRLHHNTFDMETRAKGAAYGVELTINDAELDHNYFNKGTCGIANWDKAMKNWSIHHNVFYALGGTYPGEIVRSQSNGLHNVKIYNNTVEFAGSQTMNVIGIYGGASDQVDVRNNIFMDNNSSYSYYNNQFIHQENGASLTNLIVENNSFSRLPIGDVGGSYSKNLTGDPQLSQTGDRPFPYYAPKAKSPLINAGLQLGLDFAGLAPDIGAFEIDVTVPDVIDIFKPATPSSASALPLPAASPSGAATVLILDSSDASLTGVVTTGYDMGAYNGSFFYVAPGTGRNFYIPSPASASFKFQLENGGNYTVWAKVKSPTESNQTYQIYNGRGKWFNWDAGVHGQWTWVKITDGGTPASFAFSRGENKFEMGWSDDDVQIDQLIVTDDPSFTPSN